MKCAYCNGVMPEMKTLRGSFETIKIVYHNAPFCRPKCALRFAQAAYQEGYRIAATSNQVTRV